MDFNTQYIGQQYDFDDCEVLAANLPKELLANEAELYKTKWFDYRTIHHVTATYLLVHHYNIAYGQFLKQVVDRKLQYVKAISGKDLFMQKRNDGKKVGHREANTFIKMRQKADEFGMPYSIFCRAAINHFIKQGWLNPPRPFHTNTPEVFNDCLAAWDAEKHARLRLAESDFFLAENFSNHPDQVSYRDFVVDAINKRQAKHYALGSAMKQGALDEEFAHKVFSTEVVEWAKQTL